MSSKDILEELPQKYKNKFYDIFMKEVGKQYGNVNPQLYSEKSINKRKKKASILFKNTAQLIDFYNQAHAEKGVQPKISKELECK